MSELSQSEPSAMSPAKADLPTESQTQAEKSLLEVALAGAIALAKDSKNYAQASEQFTAITAQIEQDSPEAAKLLRQLWKEYLSAQRSALFYESLSNAEAGLSEKMTANTIQLKQNYMRLIQEQ
ncbi:MAG: hypothetical protein HLUCCA11_02460 [Phormidesmis priestleyi Ana]|uniref:Uncharacterized protein n=1 Tax=Phormidesmis priestleyi Ana TaxID=1666911 RepID=A0A0P7Z304_9CYAN|nr:MAG: hypothetical protein HLUCCA11_02460 [Phormidesmis priestleyi Ana]